MCNYNVITAIINIINNDRRVVGDSENSHNRLHAMGEPLEVYLEPEGCGE